MKIANESKAALIGAIAGASAVAALGFTMGGWVTGAKAEAAASARADAAVVTALAPVCVAAFRRDAAVDVNLAAMKKVQAWSQGEFIEKGGWATVAGSSANAQTSSVARACSEILNKT